MSSLISAYSFGKPFVVDAEEVRARTSRDIEVASELPFINA
jgi:hypothetical protein